MTIGVLGMVLMLATLTGLASATATTRSAQ